MIRDKFCVVARPAFVLFGGLSLPLVARSRARLALLNGVVSTSDITREKVRGLIHFFCIYSFASTFSPQFKTTARSCMQLSMFTDWAIFAADLPNFVLTGFIDARIEPARTRACSIHPAHDRPPDQSQVPERNIETTGHWYRFATAPNALHLQCVYTTADRIGRISIASLRRFHG